MFHQEKENHHKLNHGTAALMRQLNYSAILDFIREKKITYRSEISRTLDISLPTVIRIVDALIDKNLVVDEDRFQASGGRPRSIIKFNTEGHAVIGIDLGGTKMYGTVADIGGYIQEEMYQSWEHTFPDKQKSLESLFILIDSLLASPRPPNQTILGICVGAPSITIYPEGIVSWAPSLGWRDFPLREILFDRYKIPVRIENDVNLAALGEFGFGMGKGTSSLVCISIGTGIGAGIVIDRRIFRGSRQSAGEIGYLLPGLEFIGRRHDVYGALEELASGIGISKRAQTLINENGLSSGAIPTAEDVFAAARQGKTWAKEIVDDTINYYCLAVSAISTIIDPEIIILGGGMSKTDDLFIEPILDRLDGVIPSLPKIVASQLGYKAAVMGAIILILDIATDYVAIKQS